MSDRSWDITSVTERRGLGRVKRIVMNYRGCSGLVELIDGSVHEVALGRTDTGNVVSAVLDVATRTLALDAGEVAPFIVDIGGRLAGTDHVRTRPVVYLDQNHWIALARAWRGDGTLANEEEEAAAEIVGLAVERKISLPLSAAHFVETGRVGDRRRRNVARTMLFLSRGHVMRHPMSVQDSELRVALTNAATHPRPCPIPAPIMTLDPGALFSPDHDRLSHRASFLQPHREHLVEDLVTRITATAAQFSALLDEEPEPRNDAMPQAWADSFQGLANSMVGNATAQAHKRKLTRAKFVAAMSDALPRQAMESGMTHDDFTAWLSSLEDESPAEVDIRGMPYLGLLREVMHHRLSNADDRWEVNDLNDIHYLSCAAGYADVCVGEKKHSEYLKRAQRSVPPVAVIQRNLRTALPDILAAVQREETRRQTPRC